jgi:hypothetical protein
MDVPQHQPVVLALGVLPSSSARADWHHSATNRRAARRTWLAAPLPTGFAYRFAVLSLAAPSPSHQRRRRLASAEHALEREIAHAEDVVVLDPLVRSFCACAELTHAWFAYALKRWPAAGYLGKTEDDIYVNVPSLIFELTRLPTVRPIWWGLFVWTGSADADANGPKAAGCWGGSFEDNPLITLKGMHQTLGKERECPEKARPLSPAPTHEIDVRATPLARALAYCEYPIKWLRFAAKGGAGGLEKCPNDCAGVQGAWLTKCLTRNVTLAHATWTKVHSKYTAVHERVLYLLVPLPMHELLPLLTLSNVLF